MKRYDGLYSELTTFENLYLAYRKAARGKRGKRSVADFEINLDDNLFQLQEELVNRTYCPGGYASFYIRDPKRRLVSAAPFRDRVVHHALCNLIEPIFERTFIGDSYANRVGKGTHAALDRAQLFARRYPYVLQCDIVQFFPDVDHAILREILERKITDDGVRWLMNQVLRSGEGVLAHERGLTADDFYYILRPRGLPIGNLTSQFWANVYLNELDQFSKRYLHCRAYLRYVDDFLFFAEDKRQLWRWKDDVRDLLAYLRLALHERSSTVYPTANGIPFLGFRVYPTQRRLKRRNGVAFARRLRAWRRQVAEGRLTLAAVRVRVQGWVAHAQHGNTWRLRASLLSRSVRRAVPSAPT